MKQIWISVVFFFVQNLGFASSVIVERRADGDVVKNLNCHLIVNGVSYDDKRKSCHGKIDKKTFIVNAEGRYVFLNDTEAYGTGCSHQQRLFHQSLATFSSNTTGDIVIPKKQCKTQQSRLVHFSVWHFSSNWRVFAPNEIESELTENKDSFVLHNGNQWQGLLVKFQFICGDNSVCLMAKITGKQNYAFRTHSPDIILSDEVKDTNSSPDEKEKEFPPAIIIGVVLGFIAIALFIVLVVIYINKRNKLKREGENVELSKENEMVRSDVVINQNAEDIESSGVINQKKNAVV